MDRPSQLQLCLRCERGGKCRSKNNTGFKAVSLETLKKHGANRPRFPMLP